MWRYETNLTSSVNLHMTDHTGPLRYECHPGSKFWHPPVEVNQFWHTRSGFRFWKTPQKNSSVWNKTVTGTISNNFCLKLFPRLLINIIFFSLTKTLLGCQKLVPGWHSQRRGPAWSVIWGQIIYKTFEKLMIIYSSFYFLCIKQDWQDSKVNSWYASVAP